MYLKMKKKKSEFLAPVAISPRLDAKDNCFFIQSIIGSDDKLVCGHSAF